MLVFSGKDAGVLFVANTHLQVQGNGSLQQWVSACRVQKELWPGSASWVSVALGVQVVRFGEYGVKVQKNLTLQKP